METKAITEILNNNDIKPSYARIQIYKYLEMYKSHPTVDEIYLHLIDEIPTLSKTTVYNTLNLFSERELVLVLNLDNLEKRYELVEQNHIHFICESCKKIYDIPYEDNNLLPKGFENFQIEEKHIFLKGQCPKCSKLN